MDVELSTLICMGVLDAVARATSSQAPTANSCWRIVVPTSLVNEVEGEAPQEMTASMRVLKLAPSLGLKPRLSPTNLKSELPGGVQGLNGGRASPTSGMKVFCRKVLLLGRTTAKAAAEIAAADRLVGVARENCENSVVYSPVEADGSVDVACTETSTVTPRGTSTEADDCV